jgi:hypothetical protein
VAAVSGRLDHEHSDHVSCRVCVEGLR